MKYVPTLSELELETLKEAVAHHSNHRARTRAHAIVLSSRHYSILNLRTFLMLVGIRSPTGLIYGKRKVWSLFLMQRAQDDRQYWRVRKFNNSLN